MRARRFIVLFFLLALPVPGALRAQEEAVQQAIVETLAAWTSGSFETFQTFYAPDTRGFFLDGGLLVEGFNLGALQAAYNTGFRAEFEVRDLDVRLVGDVALSTSYLEGALTLPSGSTVPSGKA